MMTEAVEAGGPIPDFNVCGCHQGLENNPKPRTLIGLLLNGSV